MATMTADATRTADTRMSTRRRILWGAQIFLAAFLLLGSALPKFFGQEDAVETFTRIGWGEWFMYFTGVVEAAGAIGLLIPRLAGVAATGLIGLMIGAVIVQITVIVPASGAPLWVLLPAAYGVVFALIAWDRRPETRALLAGLRR